MITVPEIFQAGVYDGETECMLYQNKIVTINTGLTRMSKQT